MAISESEVSRRRPSPKTNLSRQVSFEEKSVWIQLISLTIGLGLYFVVAGRMLMNGVAELAAYMPLFAVAVVLIVAVNVTGHVVATVASRPDGPDERDRLIGWRAESSSSWILAAGVIAAIACLIVSVSEVWVAHLLLLSLFIAEVAKDINQLVYYRRGMSR